MNEEHERPKTRLKIRKTEENVSSNPVEETEFSVATNNSKDNSFQKNATDGVQKIKIQQSQNPKKSENEEQKIEKKHSFFEIFAIILTFLLVVAIIVEIGVMIWLKNNTQNLKNKNNLIPEQASISANMFEQVHSET